MVNDDDRKALLSALENDGPDALKYADDSLKADRKFVLAAVKLVGFALNCADKELQNDPELKKIAGGFM